MERTFMAILPEWVERNLVGLVISRFEDLGLKLVFMKMVMLEEDDDFYSFVVNVSKKI